MLNPPPPQHSTNPLSHLIPTILSYDGNVMLAALISLLLVILFVLLLHIYAKWFLAQARHRRRSSVSMTSRVLGPPRPRFHTFTIDTTLSSPTTRGLHPSVIASIPLFVYDKSGEHDKHAYGLECIICLSLFESQDVGRKLRKCGHAFHAHCIDMWLHSHSNCPICRAPATATYDQSENKNENLQSESLANQDYLSDRAMAGQDPEVGMASCEPAALESVIDHRVPTSVEEEIGMDGSLTACSSSSSLSSQASSLKRMLSRSRSERKVHPSSLVNELSLQQASEPGRGGREREGVDNHCPFFTSL